MNTSHVTADSKNKDSLIGADNINTSKIIYSINFEDVQNVAEEEIGRRLTKKELQVIEDKIGDYINWYSAIEMTIRNEVLKHDEDADSE